jgi:hypothetical protein
VNYVADNGFVSVSPGGLLELNGVLPNYILQSITDQSWIVQFKAFASSGQNIKMILTTSPSDTGAMPDFTGFRLLVTDLGISAIYYKGVGDTLVSADYVIDPTVDLTVGIHQVVITNTPTTQTLNLYFDNEEAITRIAPTNDLINYGPGSTIVLNKLSSISPPDIIEYHRIGIYNRVLSQGEVNTVYNQIDQPIPVEEVTDPNSLFDVNFNYSLDADYSIDGNALIFEASNPSAVTLSEDFVTIKPGNHIKLTTGLPEYLKHTGDQSWVVNWRSEAPSSNRFIIQTTLVGPDFHTAVEQRTGFFFSFTLQFPSSNLLKRAS